jgi:sugar O-acyltransferase (sialic acid O-acetyltransferase NeuD family)
LKLWLSGRTTNIIYLYKNQSISKKHSKGYKMNLKLGIYGCGGLGKEVYDLAVCINNKENRWDDIFFISDFDESESYCKSNILTFDDVLEKNIEIVIAIGEPSERKKLYDKIVNHKLKLTTLIDPTSFISPTAKIGEGTIVMQFVTISSNVEINTNCVLHPNIKIGHDTTIGKHTTICVNATLGGGMEIGEGVYVGMGAASLEKLTIGDNSILGMGAVLYKNLEAEQVALGNPARVTRGNDSKKVFNSK